MKNLIKILTIPLKFTGFNAISESVDSTHKIRRFFFYISGFIIIYCFTYSVCFNPNLILSDKIFLFIADIDFMSIMLQSLLFWHEKENVFTISKNIEKLHEPRDETWLAENAKSVFDECHKTLYKISK